MHDIAAAIDNSLPQPKSRHRDVFARRQKPPRFRVQARDLEIVRQVFRHRFLRPVHIQLLLGGSAANLARRCRLLWEHRFLERPLAQRPVKFLVEELIYGLGPAGVAVIRRLEPRLRDAELEWVETPKKQRGWPFIEHQLGVVDFLVALEVAARGAGLELRWGGHVSLKRHRVRVGETVLQPDAYFVLRDPRRNRDAHYFLELDRGNVSLKRMHERFDAYYRFWRDGKSARPFEHFRVLTVAPNETHMNALRNASRSIGVTAQHNRAWWGLWFTHAGAFSLGVPARILTAIFLHAYEGESRSLVEQTTASTEHAKVPAL